MHDACIDVKYTLSTTVCPRHCTLIEAPAQWIMIRASVYSATTRRTPVSGEFVSGVVITRPQLYKWKTETLSHAAFSPFHFFFPPQRKRLNEKVGKLWEQKWLNRLQMVQFECPRHPNPSVCPFLKLEEFPFLSISPLG